MTIQEAIDRCSAVKPNQYSDTEKIEWLSELDGRVFVELIETHENISDVTFSGYREDTPPDTKLLIPAPFSQIYISFLCSKIDFYNAEYTRYNNSAAIFNSQYNDYANYYNRTHIPCQNNSIQI